MASSSTSSSQSKASMEKDNTGTGSISLNLTETELSSLGGKRSYNIADIASTPSSANTPPRLFQPGRSPSLKKFAQAFSAVYKATDTNDRSDSDEAEDIDDTMSEKGSDLQAILDKKRETELQELSQNTQRDKPHDDEIAQIIVDEIILGLENAATTTNRALDMVDDHAADDDHEQEIISSMRSVRSYPPVHQTGAIDNHDRPFAEYGHLDRQAIAAKCGFNLQLPLDQPPVTRLHAKSFAILACTPVSKDVVMDHLKNYFDLNFIQYICVSEDNNEFSQQPCLHVQLIFKAKIDRKKPFLDEITGTRCNYQVTNNDLAWNEFLKKGGNFTEFGEFKSVKTLSQRQWPAASSQASAILPPPSSLSTRAPFDQLPASGQPSVGRATTVRGKVEENRQKADELARHALGLAEKSIEDAMAFIEKAKPDKFMHHSKWYAEAFRYVNVRAQQRVDQTRMVDKEYVWPDSFPDCTPGLRAVVEQWIRHHFYRVKRAKCLILIGPTGTGKTSFALSLPGQVNYFQGRWNLDNWNDYARYSVYDDIPWDDFEKWNYPLKKGLLTQNGTMGATDKYRGTLNINVRQPAIVLLNRENAGSLLAEATTEEAEQLKAYWKKRATVFEMDKPRDVKEYFYKRPSHGQSGSSTASSMGSAENRLGGPEEFDEMIQRYQQQQPQRGQ